MDEKNTGTATGQTGKTYSIDEILLEYGRAPVKPSEGAEPAPPQREASAQKAEESPADRLPSTEKPPSEEDDSDLITAEEEFGGEWGDEPDSAKTDELPPKAEEPAISVPDFDEAYKQQRKEITNHRKLVLKTRLRTKRYRYIKEVKKIAGELGDERRQREREELEKLRGKNTKEHISYYTSMARSLALRQWVCLFLSFGLIYITISSQAGLPVPEALVYRNHPYLFLCVNIVLLGGVMLSGLDIFTSGLRSLLKFKPDMESIVAISALLNFLYCISVVVLPKWGGYISFSGLAAMNMYFALLARRRVYSSRARALGSAEKVKAPQAVIRLEKAYKNGDCFAKVPVKSISGFEEGLEEKGFFERFAALYAVVSAAALAVFAFVCLFRGEGARIPFYVSSAAAMLPSCGLIIGSALPYGRLSKRLMREGVAIGGSEGLDKLGKGGRVILTDSDLMGPQSITLQGYKLFGDIKREQAITFTASVLTAAGCGIARQFQELASKEFCTLLEPSEMEYSEYGGIKAVIGQNHIMVGTAPYMYRMGLRPPSDIKLRTAVFCALNMELVAVFALRYLPNDTHRHWINLLASTGRNPILASRDFNVTPALVEQRFRIKSAQLEYPEIEQRLELNSTLETSDGAFGLLVLRDTLEGYAGGIEGCRRLKKISRINLLLGIISSAFGALSVAFLLMNGSYVAVSPLNILLYGAIWSAAIFILSGWVSRF